MEYGVLSILPALIVIIFALLTKKTLEALLLGTLSTYIIMYGFGFGSKWSEAFFTSAGNPDNQWVLIVCGLFGTGGGLVLVPAFIYMLEIEPKKARATSLTCMLIMVIISSIFYYKNNYIDWKAGGLCAIGGVIGGYIGAKVLKKISDYILKIIFILFILYYSARMIFVL